MIEKSNPQSSARPRVISCALLAALLWLSFATPLLADDSYLRPGQPDGVALLGPPPLPGSAEAAADLACARMVFKGRTAAAGIAAMNTIGILGGFVGPYWIGIAKDLTGNDQRGLTMMAVPMLVAAGITLYLRRQSLRALTHIALPAAASP